MYEKLTKFPNFTWRLAEKIFSPDFFFWGWLLFSHFLRLWNVFFLLVVGSVLSYWVFFAGSCNVFNVYSFQLGQSADSHLLYAGRYGSGIQRLDESSKLRQDAAAGGVIRPEVNCHHHYRQRVHHITKQRSLSCGRGINSSCAGLGWAGHLYFKILARDNMAPAKAGRAIKTRLRYNKKCFTLRSDHK